MAEDGPLAVVAVAVNQKAEHRLIVGRGCQTGKRQQALDLRGKDEVVAAEWRNRRA